MEKTEIKITPQDIIDREFRVKFRGFDMAEVDAFLEEVAETFFQLTEENTLLNEKVFSLQQELETIGSTEARGQFELPAELENILEDLKQDTGAISAVLASLKQDRQAFDVIQTKLEKIIASVRETGAAIGSRPQVELPADLAGQLEEFAQNSTVIAAELDALKENRQAFESLRQNFGETIKAARDAAATLTSRQGDAGIPGDLQKTLENIKQGNDSVNAELAGLKQEITALAGMRDEIKAELQNQLSSHFKTLGTGFSTFSGKESTAVPGKKEALLAAEIIEGVDAEPREEEGTALPDFRKDEEAAGEGDLEFLSEDDILDVDKLRGIFQSVLDEGPDEGHAGHEGEDAAADLLFLEDDLTADDHEPEVTFSLEEHKPGGKDTSRKK